MKNRKITSVIISICLILGLFPVVSFANAWDGTSKTEPSKNADGAYEITNAAKLAWFAENAGSNNAVLTNDIDLADKEWTPIGSKSSKYSGSFNGNGHTIRNLAINSLAEYTGLFGYVTGEVSGVNVTGECTYTGQGYSTSYTGGIAAYNEGKIEKCTSDVTVTTGGSYNYCGGIAGYNKGVISACINRGNVTSKTTSGMGGIAGDLNGGTIKLSANYGDVVNNNTSGGYYAGGIAGRIEGSSELCDVYNVGNIECYTSVGGIAGSVTNVNSIKNCYSSGNVNCLNASSSYAYYGAIASYGYSSNPISKMSNCYFLKTDTINASLSAVQKSNSDTVKAVSDAELKSGDIIALIGGAFEIDSTENPINNGYPILKWQNPNASYKAVITVSPKNASVILKNSVNEEIAGTNTDGAYIFDNLPKDKYTYTVSRDEDDYIPQNGEFTIDTSDYYNTAELVPNMYDIAFTVSPSNADFSLKLNDTELPAVKNENGVYEYLLPNGSYTYIASAFGYAKETDSITVNKAAAEKTVTLTKLPTAKITFSLTDKTANTALDNFRMEVKSGGKTIDAEVDGSYMLPVGAYIYKVMCSGYAKCVGEFTVTEDDITAGTKIITLETEPSAAWDGDLDEPAYSDGAWQIATGNELAWFAGYVNGTQTTEKTGVSCDAYLTADIDLGDEISWTPIGETTYTNPYEGTFNGKGHTVTGLYINTDKTYLGLFGNSADSTVIKNLTVEGNIISTSTSSTAYVGGIVGYNNYGNVYNCISRVNIRSAGDYTGGICGYSRGSYSKTSEIVQCANQGSISYKENTTGKYKGGICGYTQYVDIRECANEADIASNGNFAGGIVGEMGYNCCIEDCYNSGKVTSGAFAAGGMAGSANGYSGSDILVNCYSVGHVTSLASVSDNIGALIGDHKGGDVKNSYCLIEEDGVNKGLEPVGKSSGIKPAATVKTSADEMRTILDGLNTNKVWTQNNKQNSGYPILKWQEVHEDGIKIDGIILTSDNAAVNTGRHKIEIDYSDAGKNTENGLLALAMYSSNGTLEKLWLADKTYKISADYDMPDGAVIKVLFWKDNLEPIIKEPIKINVSDAISD